MIKPQLFGYCIQSERSKDLCIQTHLLISCDSYACGSNGFLLQAILTLQCIVAPTHRCHQTWLENPRHGGKQVSMGKSSRSGRIPIAMFDYRRVHLMNFDDDSQLMVLLQLLFVEKECHFYLSLSENRILRNPLVNHNGPHENIYIYIDKNLIGLISHTYYIIFTQHVPKELFSFMITHQKFQFWDFLFCGTGSRGPQLRVRKQPRWAAKWDVFPWESRRKTLETCAETKKLFFCWIVWNH